MTRTVTATITEPNGQPREGLAVFFDAPDGHADLSSNKQIASDGTVSAVSDWS